MVTCEVAQSSKQWLPTAEVKGWSLGPSCTKISGPVSIIPKQ